MRVPGKARDYKAEHYRRQLRSPNYKRKYLIASRYGISLEKYAEILAIQKGSCAICGFVPAPKEHALCVDHCHKSNKIRGLLCHWCNIGIGRFKDSTKLMKEAISYLTKRKHYGIIKKQDTRKLK